MRRTVIVGSGMYVPPNVVRNEALARIMDTSDEWIRTRSGIEERHFADTGEGSAAMGTAAATRAIAAAGIDKGEIDAVVFATMTPDFVLPGNGPLLQDALGLGPIPTFDLRQQCSGFVYGLDVADSLIRSGKYNTVLLVGAEAHSPFMPWQNGWESTITGEEPKLTPEGYDYNTKTRDRTVLFGDGAGAVVLRGEESESRGLLCTRLYTDGSAYGCLTMPGAGFRQRPFVSHEQIDAGLTIPVMDGREVFRQALKLMPDAVRQVCADAGVAVESLDLVLVHQANLRIIEGVQKSLGLPPERVPHNIERYGNTTAGTLPILFHECVESGKVKPGMLVVFTALGSGLHWGAALYRV